jgi:hypothetical protein
MVINIPTELKDGGALFLSNPNIVGHESYYPYEILSTAQRNKKYIGKCSYAFLFPGP